MSGLDAFGCTAFHLLSSLRPDMAKQMVTNFGFSDIGPWSLVSPGVMSQDMIMRMMAQNEVSEVLQEDIDRNVKKILDNAYEQAKV